MLSYQGPAPGHEGLMTAPSSLLMCIYPVPVRMSMIEDCCEGSSSWLLVTRDLLRQVVLQRSFSINIYCGAVQASAKGCYLPEGDWDHFEA